MAFFDLPLDQLRTYLPEREEPADFDAFWRDTLASARAFDLNPVFEPVHDLRFATIDAYDVTFSGFGGQRIKGWLTMPKQRDGKVPCVVEFIGYGGGRAFVTDWTLWSSLGFAHLVMDTRGQGSGWQVGDTGDPEPEGTNPHHPGYMTRGVASPETYYYRRLFTDCARAVEAALAHEAIDPARVAVTGGSQGGGMSIAAAALSPSVVLAMPDVPFLCHYRRATAITDGYPYQEIVRYLLVHRDQVDQVFSTLSYFDGVNFAARAKARALFSVGMMDEICPPSTVFAAHNHWAGEKDIRIYHYNHHEGGGSFQTIEKVKFAQQHLQGEK